MKAIALLIVIIGVAVGTLATNFVRADFPSATPIVAYVIENHGSTNRSVLATFGAVFAPGDLPQGDGLLAVGQDGQSVAVQLDAKATNKDKSLRHGVITLVIPNFEPRSSTSITLERTIKHAPGAPPIGLTSLPANFDVLVHIQSRQRELHVSAKSLLATQPAENWLSGPIVSEWWFHGPLLDGEGVPDPHMQVEFGIRSYGKNLPLRVEVIVENDWTFVPSPKTEFYDAKITANGRNIFSKPGMIQPSHTRWRVGFWWDTPIFTYVKQNLEYLEKTGAVPHYDINLKVSAAAMSRLVGRVAATSQAPMSPGISEPYMPTTGGRPDIGPLPRWQVLYLLTMDPRAYEATLRAADLGGSFSSHYRDEKTGRPVSLEDRPLLSTHENYVGHGDKNLPLPDKGGYKDPLVADSSHEPALDFLPYLITGDRYDLEELEFWTEWNASGTAPQSHGFGKGLVNWDQVRGQAWSMRTLAQAEFVTPDSDPLKAVFRHQLAANIDWYTSDLMNNPSVNSLHIVPKRNEPYDNGRAIAPWQDDFFTWSLGYVRNLGDVDPLALVKWKSAFAVQRMVGPGFCWILAPAYTLRVRTDASAPYYRSIAEVYQASLAAIAKHPITHSVECGTKDMANALDLKNAGEMVNQATAPEGYSGSLQAALAIAVDANAFMADDAWRVFVDRPIKPDFATAPEWDIVPLKHTNSP